MALLLMLVVPLIFVLQQLYIAVYNFYFHPLARAGFKGPTLWIAFPVFRYIAHCRGIMDKELIRLHQQYGDVVRFSDDCLSFNTAQAWKDIYGYGHGSTQWPKLEFRDPDSVSNILFSDDANHARFRRALGHAFSEKALGQQEQLIKSYVDLLVDLLAREAADGRTVDMTMMYTLCTFDIISDLAFGEPSDNLRNKELGERIETIFKFLQIVPFVMLMNFYPAVWRLIGFFKGKSIKQKRENLFAIGREAATKRKADRSKDGRADFMEFLMKHSEEKEPISDAELGANAHILFMAGSETTATLLAGATYWLLRYPDVMAKVTEEVRQAFNQEEDITFSSASARLPYMLACLEEALRMYPPVPTVLLRTTPADAISKVSGHDVPPGTNVGVSQLGTNYSDSNFNEPYTFVPERWMPGSGYDSDNRDARQPFSLGPRNCIGKNLAFSEMRQILARVLWRFDLEFADQSSTAWADQKSYTLWAKGPLMCTVKDRTQSG